MSRSDTVLLRPPQNQRLPQPRTDVAPPAAEPRLAYGRPFWLAYLSNTILLTAVALLFRYADFVTLLGGTEFHLGWIVGIGMIGSFCMRMALGTWIDRYGARPLWLGSLGLFVVTCFAHLAVASHTGAAIYLLRISYCCAVAGINGASMTFVSARGPDRRLAELVGMLGTAGFMGTVAGTLLGDFLANTLVANRMQVVQMFAVSGLLGIAAIPFAWAATRREKCMKGKGRGEKGEKSEDLRPKTKDRRPKSQIPNRQIPAPSRFIPHPSAPSLPTLLRRHNPGLVLIIGVAMGVGLGLPGTFLRTYAAELRIPRIGLFFLVYAVAAIITRVLTRRWPERFGPRRIILLGMAGMVASLLMFLLVRTEWQLVVPAIAFGCSHAILFPSVVAAGSVTFPLQHRGLATVLVLATWDLGLLLGSPTAGAVLRYSPRAGLPPYPTMFVTMAALLAIVGLWYALGSHDVKTESG
jgi:MFS family permease